MVLDVDKQLVSYQGKIIHLQYLTDNDSSKQALILRTLGESIVPLSDTQLGRAVYESDWVRLYGTPALDYLMLVLNKSFIKHFAHSPLKREGKEWSLDPNVEYRQGVIENGQIVSIS